MSRHPFLRILQVTAGVLALTAGGAAWAQPAILSTTSSQVGPLERTEWIVQAGPAAIDTFRMTRLLRDGASSRGAILMLPALGTSFALYEQRDTNGAFGTSIAEFFAVRGYEVWGYSPRFEGIPAGTCEAGVVDCSAMAGWDLQSMVDDISFVRDQIELAQPGISVAAGGLSLGGMLAVALANADGDRYAGVFPWEGMLVSQDPQVNAMNAGYCAGLEAQLAAGIVFDAVGNGVFKAIAQQAATAPEGLNTIPLFPPFFTNHNVLVATLSVPTPGPTTAPVPDYIFTAGSVAEDRLFFASEARLFENILTAFSSYSPVALVRDIPCSLAGLDTTHTANLGSYAGAVLMIGGERGFGGYMQDQLDAFSGAASRELLVEPDFGHVDHFFSPQHRRYVERPLLRWLRQVL